MFETDNSSRDEYTFKKHQKSHNSKKWKRDMSFALEGDRVRRYVKGMVVSPSLLKAKKDKNENRIEKMFAKEGKICEVQDNACKTVAKIKKISRIQYRKNFFVLKPKET